MLMLNFGPACLNDFDGMFALAIYDAEKKKVFLARDRAGKSRFTITTVRTAWYFLQRTGAPVTSFLFKLTKPICSSIPGWVIL